MPEARRHPLVFALASVLGTLIILGCVSVPEAAAQKSLAKSLYQASVKAYNGGDYSEALKLIRKSNDIADKEGGYSDYEMAYARLALGEVLRSMNYLKEAEKYFKEAETYAKKLGRNKNEVLELIYNSEGILALDLSNFPESERLFKKAQECSATQLHLPIDNLALLYMKWGRLEDALPYIEKGNKLAKVKKYKKTIAIPYSLHNEGMYAFLKGDYKTAEEKYKQALDSCDSLFGSTHHYYGLVAASLADLYKKQSRFEDSEMLFRAILSIRKSTFDESHPMTADTMVDLADVLAEEGKYKEATELANRALEICTKEFGTSDNYFVAKAKRCLGNIRRQDGRYEESAKLLTDAHEMLLRVLGTEVLSSNELLVDLAKVRLEQSKYGEAEKLLKQAESFIDSSTGPDHPQRAELAVALGYVYMREGKFDQAVPQLEKAMALASKVLGENSKVTASSARDLGELLFKQKKFAESATYLQKALNTDETVYGAESPQVAADLLSLAAVYEAQGSSDKAAPLEERASAIRKTLYGASASAQIQIPAAFASASDRPVRDKWALVVGISNFKDSSINLKFAAKDATDFSNFLINKENFAPDHVKLLTDDKATRQNIIDVLGNSWLGSKAKKDDLVVIYVSSHGSRSMSDAGGVNFLVAHDTDKNSLVSTGIPMQWLSKIIKEQVPSDRVVLVLDVCHSGAAAEGGKGLSRVTLVDPTELKIGTGQMVLCSSMAEQVSWESKTYENSVFTRRLIEALQTEEQKTSLLEAYKRLKTLVESEVLRDRANLQTPVLYSKGWTGSDPILGVKPTSVSDSSGSGSAETTTNSP